MEITIKIDKRSKQAKMFYEYLKTLPFVKIEEIKKEKRQNDALFLEEYNQEIKEAEEDIEAGNFYTSQEVEKRMQQWGRK